MTAHYLSIASAGRTQKSEVQLSAGGGHQDCRCDGCSPLGVLKSSLDRRGRREQQALREDSFPCASLGRCPPFCGDQKQDLGQTTIDDRRGYPQNGPGTRHRHRQGESGGVIDDGGSSLMINGIVSITGVSRWRPVGSPVDDFTVSCPSCLRSDRIGPSRWRSIARMRSIRAKDRGHDRAR
jgi:hypothetical protein